MQQGWLIAPLGGSATSVRAQVRLLLIGVRNSLISIQVFLLVVFSWLPSSPAQERPRIPHVGYLSIGRGAPPPIFVQKMREQGYVNGQTAIFEPRFAEGRRERLLPLAQDLARMPVDVIFAFGDEAIVAAQLATKTIPIVMVACDAVTTGFVASLAKPGGNTTGVTCLTNELSGKRIAVFQEMLPNLKRLAVLYNPENKSKPGDFLQTSEAPKSLGMTVKGFQTPEPEDIERTFIGFAENKPDGIAVLDESFMIYHSQLIVELARSRGLPTMHSFREPVKAGGLSSVKTRNGHLV